MRILLCDKEDSTLYTNKKINNGDQWPLRGPSKWTNVIEYFILGMYNCIKFDKYDLNQENSGSSKPVL